MKIRQICMLMLFSLGVIPMSYAQTFDKLWKQVEQAEKKSLPRTVIKLTDEIYQKGEAEKNSPQMLKAYLWRMNYRDVLVPDSFYISVNELELWAKQADKPIDRAILHSLIAGIYANYASNNWWQLRQRTEIVDEEPSADIREWTANMFVEKVRTNINEVMVDSVLLLNTSSRTYIPFVELGKTSEYYHHDMYHLLALRSIAALQQIERLDRSISLEQDIERLYKKMLTSYRAKGDKEGSLLTHLNYLSWKRDASKNSTESLEGGSIVDPYESGLNELKATYKSSDICAEIYLAQANYMIRKRQQVVALQLCDEAIRLYPNYPRINALKNLRQDILSPYLNVTAASTAYPEEEIQMRISHKNLDGFTLRFYKGKKLVKEKHFTVLRPQDYQVKDTVLSFKAPGIGEYSMRILPDTPAEKDNETKFNVTRLKVLTYSLPDNQYEVVVLDNQTGHPIPNSKVTLYTNEKKELQLFTTGRDGKVVFTWKPDYRFLKVAIGDDINMPFQRIYRGSYGYYEEGNHVSEQMTLLTDRSLYRPGQTVYVKGIAYAQQSDTANVLSNKEYAVILMDANYQEVAQKSVRTNEFGSFTTDFTLPAACLNGSFSLKAGNGNTSFRVEEYKRPTFDITFEKRTGTYQLGDQVEVKGKIQSYSGVLLQDLPVKYTVRRSDFRIWWASDYTEIASGEVLANEKGEFMIPVQLEKSAGDNIDAREYYYYYSVEATVTNAAGETQSSKEMIPAGNRSLILQTMLDGKICKDKPFQMVFKVLNLDGQPVNVGGEFYLYHGSDSDSEELDGKPICTGTFNSNEEMTIHWENIPSGTYVLKSIVKDKQGKEVVTKVNTILFSFEDKRPPVETDLWIYQDHTEFDTAHPAILYFGTSRKDAYVMMKVFSGNKLLDNKALNLSDTIVQLKYPYEESYGDGVSIIFCTLRDGQIYQEKVLFKKRILDKTLIMKWETFRDKLRPGQKEEWKLKIRTPNGQAAEAEMLATMYDASLDKIWLEFQNFRIKYNQIIPSYEWRIGYFPSNSFNSLWNLKYNKVPTMELDHFVAQRMAFIGESLNVRYDEVVVLGYGMQKKTSLTGGIMIRGASKINQESTIYDAPLNEVMDLSTANAVEEQPEGELDRETLSEAPVDLRTNLAETAFFYPQLRTNEQGEVTISFTMPESLTRWKFRGYAHTKGMLMGMLNDEATTSKEFMLTPNLPRFVRSGDMTSIAASISNVTGKLQAGTVSMILFDPMTEKVISTQKQKFSVEAGKTIGVNFMFSVSDTYEVLGCRMIADSGTFSDGEQQLLPVLSDKEHLVETLPMPIRGEETRTFSLDSLFNHHSKTATDRKLTIEFTGNPAWYAIQALPSLSLPQNSNAISWVTAYYANSLASYIMNSQPRVKSIFDSWKLQGGTKDTFLSNLQKNKEVKNVLLSESPWILEAQTEEQQKERIATLFDLNNTRNNNITALTRLRELQTSSGAWSWYEGMPASRYVTTYIATMNARLAMLTGEKLSDTALKMQQNAFTYLHKEALIEYKEILKKQKDGVTFMGVSEAILEYLYLIAITDEQVPNSNKAAYEYFLSKVGEMLPSASIDTKATAAIILNKSGRKKAAEEFIASLKEHLTKTDEQGMFFAFNENPYTWGGMKIRVHVDVMEALELTGLNDEIVEEMKLWLLKNKQTQQWNSPVSTADAVYALLMKGVNLLDNHGDVRMVIGNEKLETVSASNTSVSGLGYIKRSFTEKNIVNARTIEVEKKNQGIAWGAVYAEFKSPIKDLRQQGGALNVQKKLYVERMVNNAPQLQPVTDKIRLQVGDKVVVRLSIRVDRPMDFVQLKDQRGACFEPIGSLSGYRWNGGIGYYIDIKDASTNFFFDHLGKGVYMLEYGYRISRVGKYETGLATMQCAYAPEYASHSESTIVEVEETE